LIDSLATKNRDADDAAANGSHHMYVTNQAGSIGASPDCVTIYAAGKFGNVAYWDYRRSTDRPESSAGHRNRLRRKNLRQQRRERR